MAVYDDEDTAATVRDEQSAEDLATRRDLPAPDPISVYDRPESRFQFSGTQILLLVIALSVLLLIAYLLIF